MSSSISKDSIQKKCVVPFILSVLLLLTEVLFILSTTTSTFTYKGKLGILRNRQQLFNVLR